MKCSFCGGAVSWIGNLIDNPSTECASCGRRNCQEAEPVWDDYDEGDEDCASGVEACRRCGAMPGEVHGTACLAERIALGVKPTGDTQQ